MIASTVINLGRTRFFRALLDRADELPERGPPPIPAPAYGRRQYMDDADQEPHRHALDRRDKVLRLSLDLPLIIEVVKTEQAI